MRSETPQAEQSSLQFPADGNTEELTSSDIPEAEVKAMAGEHGMLREISELEYPIQNIIRQLKDKIDSGHYDLLVGDDASGRIPALILKKIFDRQYEKRGLEKPELRFIAGGRFLDREIKENKINQLVREYTPLYHKNALLITEYIQTGIGMQNTLEALKTSGLNVEIASLSSSGYSSIEDTISEPIYPGRIGETVPLVYGVARISGVTKTGMDPHSNRLTGVETKVKQARANVAELAEKLNDWYDKFDHGKR
jgi:hypothetical protein